MGSHASHVRHGSTAEASAPAGWGTAALVGLLAWLLWAPLPLASNRPWATALLCLMGTGLLVLHAWLRWAGSLRAPRMPQAAWGLGRRQALALLPVLAYAALVLAQYRTGLLDDGAHLGSLDPANTGFYLLAAVCHLVAMLLVMDLATTPQRAAWLLGALVASGVLQVCVAVAVLASGQTFQLFFTDLGKGGRATGTFHNPDHLAGYLELCLSAGFGLLVAQFSGAQGSAGRGWQGQAHGVLSFLLSGKMLLRITLVMMVIALVLTRSRAGNAAFFVGLLVVGSVLAVRSQRLRKPALWLVASIFVIDTIVIGQWVGLDKVVQRLKDTAESTTAQMVRAPQAPGAAGTQPIFAVDEAAFKEESVQERLHIARLSLPLVLEQPWFGHGGASYYLALPYIKPDGRYQLWDHAHNDYVEIAVDTGLVGLALLLSLALATAWRCVRLMGDGQAPITRGVATAALMALVCLGLHSMVDFNLQVPATAMSLCALLALAWCVPMAGAAGGRPHTRHGSGAAPARPSSQAGRRAAGLAKAAGPALALASTGLLVLVAGLAWPMLRADFSTQAARLELADCASQGARWTDERWARLTAELREGIAITPGNPSLRTQLAQLYACEGTAHWADDARRTSRFQQARVELDEALRLRPVHAPSWGGLAVALYVLQAPPSQINATWEIAVEYGPNELAVRESMFDLALRMWPAASPKMKAWVQQRYADATPDVKERMRALAKRVQAAPVFSAVAQ